MSEMVERKRRKREPATPIADGERKAITFVADADLYNALVAYANERDITISAAIDALLNGSNSLTGVKLAEEIKIAHAAWQKLLATGYDPWAHFKARH